MYVSSVIFATGVVLLLTSLLFFFPRCLKAAYDWLIFSKTAPMVTVGLGGVCFLKNVLLLSVADFGEYRVVLFLAFGTILLLSFSKMRELLSIRGLAILLLIYADFALNEVYCEQIHFKNAFVSFIYLLVVLAMVIGTLPYLFRNFLELLLKSQCFRIILSLVMSTYGLLLLYLFYSSDKGMT
jgi:predicted membrane channel-forming protein YqfA (hemolysin III family)